MQNRKDVKKSFSLIELVVKVACKTGVLPLYSRKKSDLIQSGFISGKDIMPDGTVKCKLAHVSS